MPSRKSRLRAPIQVPASVVAARATAGARTMAEVTIRWFAGVDWGSQQHQACVLDAAGKIVGERAFPHGGAGLAALCDWLGSLRSEEHTSELQSRQYIVCRLLLAKKKTKLKGKDLATESQM